MSSENTFGRNESDKTIEHHRTKTPGGTTGFSIKHSNSKYKHRDLSALRIEVIHVLENPFSNPFSGDDVIGFSAGKKDTK